MQFRIYLLFTIVFLHVAGTFAQLGGVLGGIGGILGGNKDDKKKDDDNKKEESGGSNGGQGGILEGIRDVVPKEIRGGVTNEGKDAAPGQFPWAAALFRNGEFICTCSILSENIILTAAHCVVGDGETAPVEEFHAIANVKKSSPDVRIEFASLIPHPEYSESGIKNDIAIFKTKNPIPFSENVKPVCIARKDTAPMEYNNATAMGWGDTSRLRVVKMLPDNLKYFDQKIIDNTRCRVHYFGGELQEYKLCAGDLLKGICNGDSGGPLVHMSKDKVPVQIGVSSYGSAITGCGFITPSVFTRVSYFNDFIKEIADGDKICEV